MAAAVYQIVGKIVIICIVSKCNQVLKQHTQHMQTALSAGAVYLKIACRTTVQNFCTNHYAIQFTYILNAAETSVCLLFCAYMEFSLNILSAHAFPQNNDLGIASAMLYCLS